MTRILIGMSNFMVRYWPILLALVVAGVVGFRYVINTVEGRCKGPKSLVSRLRAGSGRKGRWRGLHAVLHCR